jgi:DNA polymerase-3 subunit alpha
MTDLMYYVYHLHSQLSNGITNIDSITDFHDYVDLAAQYGMKAMAFSEHGSTFNWLKKKEYIESKGMKYIHAIEAYLTETLDDKIRDNYHCVLIAKNYEGFKELNKMVSKSFNRNDNHFYYMPRISLDELFATSDNIIVTTACLGGVLNNGTVAAKERTLEFLNANRHRCYLEIQHHNCKEQADYNKLMLSLHYNLGIPLIAGTDTHALNDTHMEGRAMLQKSKKVRFANEDDWDLTFKSPEELVAAYKLQGALPMDVVYEAMNNTIAMADSVEEFKIDYSAKYPKLYADSEAVFQQKINEGIKRRGIKKYPNYQEYVDRIHYEYDTYKHNGAIDFMLLEEDYKTEMRNRGVKFGYSRGSVSGSIIAYLLGITEIDSVRLNLNFERFMNKERVSLADIDTDWLADDRKTVKDYLYQKEGLYCCDIVTFNTIALKGAIRDVCRGLYKDNKQSDKDYMDITNQVLALADEDIEKARKKYPEVFKYVDLVDGVIVSVGNHPAGCVVSPMPVDEWFGTFTTSSDEYPISVLNMKEIDSLNFVKLDILGLDNIGLIYKTCDAVGIPFATPDNIPPNDIDVWNSIIDDTTMIFQWESQSATAYLKQLMSPSTIEKIKAKNKDFSYMDLLSIGNGAIRPAGESYRDKLAQGEYASYGNEALDDFLKPTLGWLVYQEQIIEFLHSFCGYTMGEADIVRRGFAKKTGTEAFIPKIKEGFTATMQQKYGVSKEESDKIIINFIKVIEDASSYLFSKNHADPYSWIGYICGYLRYYYPLEFITTALNIFEGKEEKSLAIIEYAKKRGIKISPIKFRYSIAQYAFNKETNEIFKGISSIKYMNTTVANEMYALRNNQYLSFLDLLDDLKQNTSINSRQLDILIELDFFEEFGDANYLKKVVDVYETFTGKSQLKKETIDKLNIPYNMVSQFCEKETDKTFMGVNMPAFIGCLVTHIVYEKRTLKEKVEAQIEHLGYVDITDDRYRGLAAVISVDTKYSPKLKLYSLKNGTTLSCKIDKKTFRQTPLKDGDIVMVKGQITKPKMRKNAEGKFESIPNSSEMWITRYTKMQEDF